MSWNDRFFRTFWPQVGPAFTANRAQTNQEIRSLIRLVRLPAGARILDVPCGFGRHAVALARRGFRVTGVDISSDLLAQARETAASKGVSVEFRQADMRRMAYRQRFDAVLNLFTSLATTGMPKTCRCSKVFIVPCGPSGGSSWTSSIGTGWFATSSPGSDSRRGTLLFLRSGASTSQPASLPWSGRRVAVGSEWRELAGCATIHAMNW